MSIRHTIAIGSLLMASVATYGQFNQSISVDGTYIPEVVPAERLGLYPAAVQFPLETVPPEYSFRNVAAGFLPQALPIPACGWRIDRLPSRYKGYLEAGLGSWLNGILSAGYRFADSETLQAGVMLRHNSTSLWHPRLSDSSRDRRMWRYDETLGVFINKKWDDKGTLSAIADYHLGNFNYYTWLPAANVGENGAANPTQTLNDASVQIGWESSALDAFQYNARLSARYFGMRSFYWNNPSEAAPERAQGGRETHIRLDGGVGYDIDSHNWVGIDMEGDMLCYASLSDLAPDFLKAPPSYGNISLVPAYRYSSGGFHLQAGADINLLLNGRESDGERCRTFSAAPAVKADYTSGGFTIFVGAGGGTRLHTLAATYSENYYTMPMLESTAPITTPLDARVGVRVGPFGGFSAVLEGAYAATTRLYAEGWYAQWLNESAPLPEETYSLHGFMGRLKLQYDGGKWIRLAAEGTLSAGKGNHGYYLGLDRPRQTALLSAESNPLGALHLKLSYEFRGKRDMPYYDAAGVFGVSRLHNVSLLNFMASYDILPNFTVWGEGANLLNRHDGLPMLPTQGIALTAGISWQF